MTNHTYDTVLTCGMHEKGSCRFYRQMYELFSDFSTPTLVIFKVTMKCKKRKGGGGGA